MGLALFLAAAGGLAAQPAVKPASAAAQPASTPIVADIENGALVNVNGSLNSPLDPYSYLALANIDGGSLVNFSNPSGKAIHIGAGFNAGSSSGSGTNSILQAIAYRFNIPVSMLRNLQNQKN
ncbi:MAG: hypothetical protein KGL39_22290 [Patescibacteria group bacterium]|nr:hypothetical protein [Patescibacteria group bacterium]